MNIKDIVKIEPDYFIEKIDDEAAIYHPSLTKALYLNNTGRLIWDLCDGERNISEIIEIIKVLYPESHKQIGDDVIKLLQNLLENKIITLVSLCPETRVLGRDQVSEDSGV